MQSVAVEVKVRKGKNSFLEINYYRRTVKVASFLIFMMTFFLIVVLYRLISSLFLVLEYALQRSRKVKLMETEEKESESRSEANHERRRYPRFNVYWPIQFNQIGPYLSHDGRVTNLSEGGMLVQSSEPMEIGQHLKSKVSFIFGSEINTIEMQAEVVWRNGYLGKPRGNYQCGAKFLDISPRDKAKLNHLLMSLSQ
jgi:hypothetical protein